LHKHRFKQTWQFRKNRALVFSSVLLFVVFCFLFYSCGTGRRLHNNESVIIALNANDKILASKLFPGPTWANDNPSLASRVYKTDEARDLATAIHDRYREAIKGCADLRCLAKAFRIEPDEQRVMNDVWRTAAQSIPRAAHRKARAEQHVPDVELTNGIHRPLQSRPNTSLDGEVEAINYILDVYLGNKKPRYPKIDAMSYPINDRGYVAQVKAAVAQLLNEDAAKQVFFTLPMLTALRLLELNGRNEAARYEPLTGGLNSQAYDIMHSVDWKGFPYSAILVPGLGPQVAGVALDPGASRRCELAAEQFKKKQAPFIIVSGGHVHPNKTPFNEAIEMQKYLTEKLKVPASSIIIEPHARHTTTNIRNAARIIFRFGIPANKPVMIVTDVFQSAYLAMMKPRFIEELGYLPYRNLAKASSGFSYFIPDSSALKINPLDPLDP
jgi:DUF218 domain-containing protein